MNSSDNAMEKYVGEDIPDHSRILFILVGLIYVIVGVAGNLVIIVTIVKTKSMHIPHYCFIANLAVADILITGYVLPWLVTSLILRYYPVVDFSHCVFNGFLTVCVYVASLVSLLAISLNRYLNVCHNALFQRIFARKLLSSLVGCGLIWLISFLCTLPCLTGWGRFVFDRKVHYCGYDRTFSFSYTLFLLLFSIGVPVIIVFLCNFAIWRHVRQASHRIYAFTKGNVPGEASSRQDAGPSGPHFSVSGHTTGATTSTFETTGNKDSRAKKDENQSTDVASESSKPQQPSTALKGNRTNELTQSAPTKKGPGKPNSRLVTPDELALMKTVFTVFLCFAAFMSPYMISTLLDTRDQWPPVLHLSCSFTSFTNSCLNCILYGIMTPRFQNAFKSLFGWMGRRTMALTN